MDIRLPSLNRTSRKEVEKLVRFGKKNETLSVPMEGVSVSGHDRPAKAEIVMIRETFCTFGIIFALPTEPPISFKPGETDMRSSTYSLLFIYTSAWIHRQGHSSPFVLSLQTCSHRHVSHLHVRLLGNETTLLTRTIGGSVTPVSLRRSTVRFRGCIERTTLDLNQRYACGAGSYLVNLQDHSVNGTFTFTVVQCRSA